MRCSSGIDSGPLLFVIFINDISECTNVFKVSLYADGCTLSHSFELKDANTVAGRVNRALKDVMKWVMGLIVIDFVSMQRKQVAWCFLTGVRQILVILLLIMR